MRHSSFSLAFFIALTVSAGLCVNAKPEPVLRTVQEAIARLERDVLDTMRLRDELSAYLLRPDRATNDSIHLPPTLITSWEGDSVQVDVPSYVFLLDLAPTMLWTHPVVVVLVPAEVGTSARTTQHWISGPVLINGTLMNLGPMCGPNPDRVRGQAFTCSEVDTVERADFGRMSTFGVIATGMAIDDADHTAFAHDRERTVERWNMLSGPQIRNEHLTVITGDDGNGARFTDVVTAIETYAQKDTTVNKRLFVKIIGHSTTRGIVFADGVIAWDTLATTMKRAFDGDVQIELTTGYGQRLIDAARNAELRGSILVASGDQEQISKGNGSGSEWDAALAEAQETFAPDANNDNDVDQRELLLWLIRNRPSNDPALNGRPRVELLSERLRSEVGRTTVYREQMWDVNVFRSPDFGVILRTTVFADDTLRSLYLRRDPSGSTFGWDPFDVIVHRSDGANSERSVVMSFTPTMLRNEDVLLTTITEPCSGITVRQRYGAKTSDTIVNVRTATAVSATESYFRFHLPFTSRDVEQTCQVAQSPYSDHIGFTPQRFNVLPGDTTFVALWGRVYGERKIVPDLTLKYWRGDDVYDVVVPRLMLPVKLSNVDAIPYFRDREFTITQGTPLVDSLLMSDVILTNGASLRTEAKNINVHFGSIIAQQSPTSTWTVVSDTGAGRRSMSELTISGLASVDMTFRSGDARNIFIADAPCRLTLRANGPALRHFTSYRANGTAFDLSIEGTDTAQIYGFNVVEPTADQLHLRTPHVVQCTDCLIDLEKCTIDSGGRLELWQTISVTTVTPNGVPIEDATFSILDAAGRSIATNTTGFRGVSSPIRVPIGYRDEGGVTVSTPLSIQLRNLDGTTQQRTIDHTGWAHVVFEDSTTSSVNEDANTTIHIAPYPVSVGEDVQITSQMMIDQLDIYALDGARVASFTPQADRITIPTVGLFPGTYLCRARSSQATSFRLLHIAP